MTGTERLRVEASVQNMTGDQLHQFIARWQAAIVIPGANAENLERAITMEQIGQTEADRRISNQYAARDTRYTVNLTLANLSWSERDLVNSLVALLSDPALDEQRKKVVDGEVAIAMEGGEVTWIPTSDLEAA